MPTPGPVQSSVPLGNGGSSNGTSPPSGGGSSPTRRVQHPNQKPSSQQSKKKKWDMKWVAFFAIFGLFCLSSYTSLSALRALTAHTTGLVDEENEMELPSFGKKKQKDSSAVVVVNSGNNFNGQSSPFLRQEPAWWLENTEDDFFTRTYLREAGLAREQVHSVRPGLKIKHFFGGMCGHYRFNTTAMPSTSVIVTMQNEFPHMLPITVHSILARTPPELLKEIIIVDDNGIPPEIRGPNVNETELDEVKALPKVRMIHNYAREGCARSRMIGAKNATGDVLMFVDSHIEMTSSTWLEHLLVPIMENPHTMALQSLDIISDLDQTYGKNPGALLYGSVDEKFLFTYVKERFEGKSFSEPASKRLPYETPFGPGSLFAIRRDEFWRLGGYDKGLYVWGGENTELAMKMWMCGGRMVMVPCSRTGHMYRINIKKVGRWPPVLPQNLTDGLGLGYKGMWKVHGARSDNFTKIVTRNNIRVLKVWANNSDALRGYYKQSFGTEGDLPPEWAQFEQVDDAMQEQIDIRKRNQCKDFNWFDRHVFHKLLGKHHPWHPSHPRQVSCGAHKAESCDLCPQGHGKDWCNGHCQWCGDDDETGWCTNNTKGLCAKGKPPPTKKKTARKTPPKPIKAVKADPGGGKGGIWDDEEKKKDPGGGKGWILHDEEKKDAIIAPKGSSQTLSVILPCGFEHEYFERTVKSVFDATPSSVLHEIVVVDDASEPPLEPLFKLDAEKYKVKFVRNDEAMGLIGAKHTGAKAATGDILVFFDCHVKPDKNYWSPFLSLIGNNYRRVVVPTITSLDADKWEEIGTRPKGGGGGMSKCYLTFDGEFKWTTDDTEYVPIMSGGLLAMSRKWFFEVGGYDTVMKGWGGENLDQSLRIWRCGGEIVTAPSSYVAHMFRDGKHRAKYRVTPGSPALNRARAMKAHTGEWFQKTLTFPAFDKWKSDGGLTLDTSSITGDLKDLQCQSFDWYLWRFRHIYRDAGVLPREVFQIESISEDGTMEPQCLQLRGHQAWNNAGQPNDDVMLAPCTDVDLDDITTGTQWWHKSNRDGDNGCCSGLRVWNTDQCMSGGMKTSVCSLTDSNPAQVTDDGLLRVQNQCLTVSNGATLRLGPCSSATKWRRRSVSSPIEFNLLNSTLQSTWEKGPGDGGLALES